MLEKTTYALRTTKAWIEWAVRDRRQHHTLLNRQGKLALTSIQYCKQMAHNILDTLATAALPHKRAHACDSIVLRLLTLDDQLLAQCGHQVFGECAQVDLKIVEHVGHALEHIFGTAQQGALQSWEDLVAEVDTVDETKPVVADVEGGGSEFVPGADDFLQIQV